MCHTSLLRLHVRRRVSNSIARQKTELETIRKSLNVSLYVSLLDIY